MVVDYYILRKSKLDINDMYDKEGAFKGINWAAIIAIAAGSLWLTVCGGSFMVCKPSAHWNSILYPDEIYEECQKIPERNYT